MAISFFMTKIQNIFLFVGKKKYSTNKKQL